MCSAVGAAGVSIDGISSSEKGLLQRSAGHFMVDEHFFLVKVLPSRPTSTLNASSSSEVPS
jgi:hypothetical protein